MCKHLLLLIKTNKWITGRSAEQFESSHAAPGCHKAENYTGWWDSQLLATAVCTYKVIFADFPEISHSDKTATSFTELTRMCFLFPNNISWGISFYLINICRYKQINFQTWENECKNISIRKILIVLASCPSQINSVKFS